MGSKRSNPGLWTRPLDPTLFASATALLDEGFPRPEPGFWHAALQRLQRYGGNAEAGVPLGWLMLQGDEAVGVVLTPASLRARRDGASVRIVNLSSWYVRPAHRWRAGLMLRELMSDPSAVYTDLTATPRLQKMLPALGFGAISSGVALRLLPLLCLHRGRGARVRVLAPDEPWPHGGPPRSMIEAHRELGCLPLVLESAEGRQLVICKRCRVRGLPAAQLMYADSQSLLMRHRGALARHLLGLGLLLFVHDTRDTRSSLTAWFRPRDRWFARGDGFADRTDAFGSELSIIHASVTDPPRAAAR